MESVNSQKMSTKRKLESIKEYMSYWKVPNEVYNNISYRCMNCNSSPISTIIRHACMYRQTESTCRLTSIKIYLLHAQIIFYIIIILVQILFSRDNNDLGGKREAFDRMWACYNWWIAFSTLS